MFARITLCKVGLHRWTYGRVGEDNVRVCRKCARSYPFMAKIQFQKKHIHIGYYMTAEEAAIAYDKKAREVFGEFARTNF